MKTKDLKITVYLKKLFFVVLTAVTFTLLMSISSVKADVTASWIDENAGKLSITGSGKLTSNDILNIDKSKIKTVQIGNDVTSIGDNVLKNCINLKSISIPTSVTEIGASAFYDCISLISIDIPSGVTLINNDTFSGCKSLTSINIPNNVESIGDRAFYGCSGLTSVTMSKVESIGSYAFYNCSSLSSITIPNTIEFKTSTIDPTKNSYKIGDNAFASCTNLATAYVPFSSETDVDYSYEQRRIFPQTTTMLVYGISGGNGSITQAVGHTTAKSILISKNIGNLTITSIKENTFKSYYKLSTAFVPSNCITTDAFPESTVICVHNDSTDSYEILNGNINATEITIPKNTESITAGTFRALENLRSIEVESGNSKFTAIDGVLYTKDENGNPKDLICYPPQKTNLYEFPIPDTVKTIDAYAFYNCSILKKITIPASVTSIGDGAFSGCTNLESINVTDGNTNFIVDDNGVLYSKDKTRLICYPPKKKGISSFTVPHTVTDIADYAFQDCNYLTSLDLSASQLTELRANMFYNTNLSSISIPASVTEIDDNTFRDFSNLSTITVASENENFIVQDGVLYNKGKTKLICYPPKKQDTHFDVPATVTEINECAFSHCTNLKSITVQGEWKDIVKIRNNNFIIFLYEDNTGNGEPGTAIQGQNPGKTLTGITGACSGLPTDRKTIIIPPNFFDNIGDGAFNGCYYANIYIPEPLNTPSTMPTSTQCSFYNAVTFNANGGSIDMDPSKPFYYGEIPNFTFTPPDTGKAFVCWNNQVDGKGTSYHTTLPIPQLNLTLYAQWGYTVTILPNNCELTVVVVDSTAQENPNSQNIIGGYEIKDGEAVLPGTKLRVYATAQEGYENSEINVSEECKVDPYEHPTPDNTTINPEDDGCYEVTNNILIKATVTKKQYLLTLNTTPITIGLSHIKVEVEHFECDTKAYQQIDHGASVTLEADDVVDNYKFIGWFLNDIKVTSDTSYTFTIYSNVTYHARYKAQGSKTVSFVVNGQVIKVVEIVNEKISSEDLPTVPEYHGWKFNGWKVGMSATPSGNVLTDIDNALTNTDIVTVTADYEPRPEDPLEDGKITVNLTKNSKTGSAALTPASATSISYEKSQWVTYTAPYTDSDTKIFSHWELDGEKISTNPIISFRVVKDCNLTAIYTDTPVQEAPSFEIQKVTYESGKVKLEANLNDFFRSLDINSVDKVIFQYGTSKELPEDAPSVRCEYTKGNPNVVAIISYDGNSTYYIKPIVIYNNGTIEKTSAEGEITLKNPDISPSKLIISANLIGVKAENVTAVQFKYGSNPNLSEASSTIQCIIDSDGEGTYVAEIPDVSLGTDYYIQPIATLTNGTSVSSNPAQTGTVSTGGTSVTDNPAQEDPEKYITGDIIKVDPESGYNSDEKACAVIISHGKYENAGATFVAYISPPDGATIVKAGVIAVQAGDSFTGVLDFSNADYVKEWPAAVKTSKPWTYTWTKQNVKSGKTIHVRPYVIYKRSDIEHTTTIGKREKYKNES